MMKTAFRLVVALIVASGGCTFFAPQPVQARGAAVPDTVLMDALRHQLVQLRIDEQLQPERVDFIQEESVSPEVEYRWAVYRPASRPHAVIFAVVGIKGSHKQMINVPEDWSDLVSDWRPRSRGEAVRACLEVVRLTGKGKHPYIAPVAYEQDTLQLKSRDAIVYGLQAIAERARDPILAEVSVADPARWHVEAWMVEAERVLRYRCVGRSEAVAVSVIDSVPGAGFYGGGP